MAAQGGQNDKSAERSKRGITHSWRAAGSGVQRNLRRVAFIWIGFSGGPENGARPSPSSLPRRRHFSLAIHHRLFFKDPSRLDGLSYTLTSITICDLYKLRIANRTENWRGKYCPVILNYFQSRIVRSSSEFKYF